ncbi:leucine carboxyl methyltransferase 1 isoform X6 [Diaphorina citri]|uniref:Leucine carboxyl methyltransferase 1 n=1 Tax=Diaphorina citri TaxID=121845 RepID=A0A1S3CXV4_DIACI|nr:leucine carboxyl methyltransferase 1 isoform X1 [Diaphorina citri]XP_026678022.1 leucine carboxyl methyltransferase 1 isoform X2 [Diaphorina citri]XP_026678023.1 leucine carboxyl methyltransferase 1 isoform X3 [Diaphorina citri]XP_026678024.1 leucine carboxyl methyltransferase 1 isoform X4 [Diaphorina citri]XP_026678025.1 leucine carboxyl methyltransferase 1 isoform X5 [Diaphorina citri]XP_026678026.1 leucine carboxyl methyltransferase 1 isoform X6 [Diaphorina citri]KAI5756248.1 hypothetic
MNGSEEAVQATNEDANECKRCAVELRYWSDEFLQYFVRRCDRKAPEINRGYYARYKGISTLVDQFIKITGKKGQIINLGSGFDTTFWRLKSNNIKVKRFIDLDFKIVTSRKSFIIYHNKMLKDLISGNIRVTSSDLHSDDYHLVGADLGKLDEVKTKLQECDIEFNAPTLFIAECVLVYVDCDASHSLLSWFAQKFNHACFVNYEQINMEDTFGTVMMKNLRERGCLLAGVPACKNLETQRNRFIISNWDVSNAWDMMEVYTSIPLSERQRVEKLEFLDEHELLAQLFQHYCIAIGYKGELLRSIGFV